MKSNRFASLFMASLLIGGSVFVSSCKKDEEVEEPMVETIDSPLFLSSNSSGKITVLDRADSPVTSYTFNASGMDADGIYYNASSDMLYQLDRSNNKIVSYANVLASLQEDKMPAIAAQSTSNFSEGREISAHNGKLVVAQDASADNGNANKFVVYDISSSSQITYEKTISVDINLWGMDMMGNNLVAVKDNSDSIAVYNNFFSNADGSNPQPDAFIKIENLVRTHGIHYVSESDMMLLTDVGDAASATDGGIVIVQNWSTKMTQPMIAESDQIRIYGPNSTLGNPVDIAYEKSGKKIYVAERKNNTFLTFVLPGTSGDLAPAGSRDVEGVSAVYFAE